MTTNSKYIVCGAVGFLVGSASTYLMVKKHFEDLLSEEVESVKTYYSQKLSEREMELGELMTEKHEEVLANPDTPRTEDGGIDYQKIVEKLNYGQFSQPTKDSNESDALPENVQVSGPVVITAAQFVDENDDFDKITFTYFEGDGVMIDEDEEVVHDALTLVGKDNLNKFNEEEGTLYVRNELVGADYEIILREGQTYSGYIRGDYEDD